MAEKFTNKQYSLEDSIVQIQEIASDFGLKPFNTHFELVPAHIVYQTGAYGVPGRFSHWTHGRDYFRMKSMYDYGLQKIYELVINSNPAQAFLLENNALIQNKLVVAHVLGHSDFFANNICFQDSNRQMQETASLHARRIRQFEDKYGEDEVEKFLDLILPLEHNLAAWDQADAQKEQLDNRKISSGRKSEFDDLLNIGQKKEEEKDQEIPFPEREEAGLLGFLAKHSTNRRLTEWQREIMWMIRDEGVYFVPQMKTKIMNEGWAALWHLRILQEMENRGHLTFSESIEWNSLNAGVVHPSKGSMNPYYLGFTIWKDIDDKFSGRYQPDPDLPKQVDWLGNQLDPKRFRGRADYKIREVMENTNGDQSFVRTYLSNELLMQMDLYTYGKSGTNLVVEEVEPSLVRAEIANNLATFGMPVINIVVGGGDYKGDGGLYLEHTWSGRDLDLDWSSKVLTNIRKLWGRDVYLETRMNDREVLLSADSNGNITQTAILTG